MCPISNITKNCLISPPYCWAILYRKVLPPSSSCLPRPRPACSSPSSLQPATKKGQCHEKSNAWYRLRCCFRPNQWNANWLYSFLSRKAQNNGFLGIRRPKNFKFDFQMYWFFKNWLKVSIAHNTYKTINILETIFFILLNSNIT